MSRDPDDAWRALPSLKKLGDEFRELEQREPGPALQRRPRLQRVARPLLAPAGVLAAVVAVLLFIESGPAGALSVVNRAPAAAVKSGSVRFQSSVSLTVRGLQVLALTQTGAIDFAAGAYRTRLNLANDQTAIEWRAVGGVLYFSAERVRRPLGKSARWAAVRLTPPERATLASAPEADALTDPLALLRVLADTDAPVHRVGKATVDGVPTTEYHLASNLASLLRASTPTTPVATRYGSVKAGLEVWLDAQGRPRRVNETLTSSSKRGPVALRTSVSFSGYGVPVRVQAPRGVAVSKTLGGDLPKPLVGAPTRLFERLTLHSEN